MDASRIGIKLFLSNPRVHLEDVVNVFHSWIQQQALAGNLLIDVADYLHVPTGPGMVLVGHEANYATDQGEGKTGLLYQRKRPTEGNFTEKLAAAFRDVLSAAWLLEQEPSLQGKWKFDGREVLVRITDQLNAPNSDETFEKLKPAFEAFFARLLGTKDFKIKRAGDPIACFEVKMTTPAVQSVETMLARVQD